MKIILATDGTKHSDISADILKRLNLSDGDILKIITVIDMAMPMAIDIYAGYLPNTNELEKIARENAEATLKQTVEIARNKIQNDKIVIETDTLIGSPESRIVECAEDFGADLIILGSHGYNRWERLLLGSVSDSVIHHAPCSVLVVRTPDDQ